MANTSFHQSHVELSCNLLCLRTSASEPKAPSTMHCGSAVPVEWHQNISITFVLRASIQSGTLGDPSFRLCCLFLDKFVGVLSAHFSQQPSLVKSTHPHDQLDWTATVLRQCIPVTSEHTSSVTSPCSNCTSILLVTRLTQWHLDCVEPRRRLTKRIRQKKNKPSMSEERGSLTSNSWWMPFAPTSG